MPDGSPEHDTSGDVLEGLEERLQNHSAAFESLLSLTPAREYYGSHFVDGQDPSEQWNRKKQTKEQKRAAKKAKLDPANNQSALDVLKSREDEALKKNKRKREGAGDEDGREDDKRMKSEEDPDAAEARRREKADRKKEKRTAKKEKKMEKQAKAEAKKAKKQELDLDEAHAESRQQNKDDSNEQGDDDDAESISPERMADMGQFDVSGLVDADGVEWEDEDDEDAASRSSSAPTTPLNDSPAFDLATNHSASSSSSSIVPPSTADDSKHSKPTPLTVDTKTSISAPTTNNSSRKSSADHTSGTASPKLNIPKGSHTENQERIRKRIEELRAARKADGPEGKPAKSRQELLEQRRKKTEQRKATKKEQRRKAKEDEQRRQEEQLRGSGSPLGADIFSPRSPQPRETSYSFSRLAFDDGTSADPGLTGLKDAHKKKGPQDPKTALQAAQSKQSRLAGYDAEKRADIAEKDTWLNARKRAHGERVRDDTSLLKKALKRKEKAKGKAEKEWQGREQAVVKGKEMKQKKREANLAKRKEEKGSKGKKGKGGGGKKKRAGFEGRFKA